MASRGWFVVGLAIAAFGVWLIARSNVAQADSDEQVAAPEATTTTATTLPPKTAARSGTTTSTVDTDPPSVFGEELEGLTLETLPDTTSQGDVVGECDSGYGGLGIEMRSWGDVLLPYTPGYPTNEPGELWDCTPATVFGAAIAMAHAAYLDALRPELIQNFAAPTVGRTERRNDHPGGNRTADLGFGCAPIGWNWDGASTWSMLHSCGQRDPQVTYFDMTWSEGRWWIVYPDSGEVVSIDPPPDYAYYPYIGGD